MSDDTRAKMVRHFIQSSPPAEMKQIITNVRAIAKGMPKLEEIIAEACETYNLEHLVTIPVDDHRIVLARGLQNEDGLYYDPSSKRSFKVDHVNRTAEPAGDESTDPVAAPFRAVRDELHAAVSASVKDHFGVAIPDTAVAHAASHVAVDEKGVISVFVSALVSDERNQWTGRWAGVFTVRDVLSPDGAVVDPPSTVAADDPAEHLAGSTEIAMHYWEDGAAALRAGSSHKVPLKRKAAGATGNVKVLAAAVVTALLVAEDAAQGTLEATSADVQERAFKRLRRRVPLTKEPFNFSSRAHMLARELTKKSE